MQIVAMLYLLFKEQWQEEMVHEQILENVFALSFAYICSAILQEYRIHRHAERTVFLSQMIL